MTQRDWVEWHRDHDDPGPLLLRRLELVQGHLRAELDHSPAGDIRLISLCAGQGREVIGVLAGHPRRDEVLSLVSHGGTMRWRLGLRRSSAVECSEPGQFPVVFR